MNEKRMSIKKDTTPRPTRLTRAEIINKMVQKIDTKNATDRVMILSFRRESLEAKGNSCPETYFEQKLIYISIYELCVKFWHRLLEESTIIFGRDA